VGRIEVAVLATRIAARVRRLGGESRANSAYHDGMKLELT
jgi:hypothetical protein